MNAESNSATYTGNTGWCSLLCCFLAFAGAVGELGDVFVVEAQVEVSALFDDFLFAVVAPGPGGAGLVLVRRRALQPLPRRTVQGFGSGAQGAMLSVPDTKSTCSAHRPKLAVREKSVSPRMHTRFA